MHVHHRGRAEYTLIHPATEAGRPPRVETVVSPFFFDFEVSSVVPGRFRTPLRRTVRCEPVVRHSRQRTACRVSCVVYRSLVSCAGPSILFMSPRVLRTEQRQRTDRTAPDRRPQPRARRDAPAARRLQRLEEVASARRRPRRCRCVLPPVPYLTSLLSYPVPFGSHID